MQHQDPALIGPTINLELTWRTFLNSEIDEMVSCQNKKKNLKKYYLKYNFIVGQYGFILPANQIIPNSLEVLDGLIAMVAEARALNQI